MVKRLSRNLLDVVGACVLTLSSPDAVSAAFLGGHVMNQVEILAGFSEEYLPSPNILEGSCLDNELKIIDNKSILYSNGVRIGESTSYYIGFGYFDNHMILDKYTDREFYWHVRPGHETHFSWFPQNEEDRSASGWYLQRWEGGSMEFSITPLEILSEENMSYIANLVIRRLPLDIMNLVSVVHSYYLDRENLDERSSVTLYNMGNLEGNQLVLNNLIDVRIGDRELAGCSATL